MTNYIFSIRDTKVGFGAPFADQTLESAERGFAYSLSKADGLVGFAKSDYELYCIASYDTDSGQVTPVTPPAFLVGGASLNE